MGCRIIQSVSEIAGGYEALLCDLWGCYHNGIEPYPAAVAACRDFRARGGIVVLLTNAPRPGGSVQRFLDDMGAPRDSYDAIVSSGAAARAAVRSGRFGSRIYYLGPSRDVHMLTDLGLDPAPVEAAEAVLCTGLEDDRTETPDDYAALLGRMAERGLPLLCANPDIVVDRGEQRLWCAGALAELYESIGGEVVWFGKPHRPVYDRCFELIGQIAGRQVPKEKVLAAGDGIATDVAGGIAAGLDVIFVTGGLAASELGGDPEQPDPARLAALLEGQGLSPPYSMGRFR